jgi:uncharacterized protein
MGQPVVHFEVMGKDAKALQSFYAELFDWKFDTNNPMNYGMVNPDDNQAEGGNGIAGGIGQMPEGQPGYSTFYVAVPDVESALAQAEQLGGTRLMGPENVMEGLVIGLFTDPEGNIVGLATSTG